MAYPSSLDVLRTDLTGADDAAVVDHAGLHNAVNAAVMAVQAELGLDPSGAAATVAARLAAIEADSRWTNARTPTAHKASHAAGGSDVLSPADIGAATSAQGAKADTAVQPARAVSAGTGLTGGGDLSADRTLAVAAGGIGTTQLADSSVTSAKIADGTIVDADISASAGIAGSKIAGAYTAQSASYTVLPGDSVVAVDTTSGAVTLTLPAASGMTGKPLRIIKTAGTGLLTVQRAGSDTILPSNGARTSFSFPAACTTGEVMLVSTGSAWYVASGQASDETVGRRLWKWEQALAATSTTAAVGFQLIYGDTGWRNVKAELLADATTNILTWATASIRRDGNTVRWVMRAQVGAGSPLIGTITGVNLFTVPSGFRPTEFVTVGMVGYGLYGAEAVRANFDYAVNRLDLSYRVSGTWQDVKLAGDLSWYTNDSWPASLPGSASGTIPTFS